MNNFSDLLATDAATTVEVRIRLAAIIGNGAAHCTVKINDQVLHSDALTKSQDWCQHVPLRSAICVSIKVSGKVHSLDQETAIMIDSLAIDGFDIVPGYVHLASYENEVNYTEPTTYLGFNGTWTWAIDQPFYIWKHHATGQGWLLQPGL